MNISETSVALMSYFENNLVCNIPSSGGQFLGYMGTTLFIGYIENEIQNRLPLLCATGIVDKNTGNVNLDKLEDAGLKAFDKVQSVDFAGFTFHKKDFREFIAYLRSGGRIHQSNNVDE